MSSMDGLLSLVFFCVSDTWRFSCREASEYSPLATTIAAYMQSDIVDGMGCDEWDDIRDLRSLYISVRACLGKLARKLPRFDAVLPRRDFRVATLSS